MNFNEILSHIRTIIRDPDGKIVSDYDILNFWNSSALNIFQKTGALETVRNWRYPPEFGAVFDFDFEKQFAEGKGDILQVNNKGENRGAVIDFDWEAGYWKDGPQEVVSSFDYPWESAMYASRAENPPIPLHTNILEIILMIFDETKLDPIRIEDLATIDGKYDRIVGKPAGYYREDQASNLFHIYPMPKDYNEQVFDDYEAFAYEEAGINIIDDGQLDLEDVGRISDVIEQELGIVSIFKHFPTVVENFSDEVDMPDFLSKYVMYETLERIYKTSKDIGDSGLSQYWQMRKESGLKAIKLYNSLKVLTDMKIVLGNGNRSIGRKHPRLDPSVFPKN